MGNWPSLGHLMAFLVNRNTVTARSSREYAEKELGWVWLKPGVKY